MALLRGSLPHDTDEEPWRIVELPGRGTTFACDFRGPSTESPVVVLLHGWTATAALNWGASLQTLNEHFRVIALDHRGHGRGISGDAPFTLEDCADDAAALLDVLGVPEAIFVGYSMGGPIAQLVWHRHPDRVRGLVLCATAADFRFTVQRRIAVRALEEMDWVFRLIPRPVRVYGARSFLGGVVSDAAIRRELVDALDRHDDAAIRLAGRAIHRFCSTDWIGDVSVPTVVLVTERDRLVPPAHQLVLARLIPDAEVIRLDGSHMMFFQKPDDLAAAVLTACQLVVGARNTSTPRPVGRLRLAFRRWRQRRHRRRR
jgi:3-oxoadipate enol-lactonase